MINEPKIKEQIKRFEKFLDKQTNINGVFYCGYGSNMNLLIGEYNPVTTSISKDKANALLERLIEKSIVNLNRTIPTNILKKYDDIEINMLVCIIYKLGINKFKSISGAVKALERADKEKLLIALIDSKYLFLIKPYVNTFETSVYKD